MSLEPGAEMQDGGKERSDGGGEAGSLEHGGYTTCFVSQVRKLTLMAACVVSFLPACSPHLLHGIPANIAVSSLLKLSRAYRFSHAPTHV